MGEYYFNKEQVIAINKSKKLMIEAGLKVREEQDRDQFMLLINN